MHHKIDIQIKVGFLRPDYESCQASTLCKGHMNLSHPVITVLEHKYGYF